MVVSNEETPKSVVSSLTHWMEPPYNKPEIDKRIITSGLRSLRAARVYR